jgi:hypothetical protein
LADKAGLFPGAILLALAVSGAVIGWRDARRRRWVTYFALAVLVAMLLALGPNLTVVGWQPFATLRQFVPGLDELRSPYRFAVIMQMLLPTLAAMALASLRVATVRWGTAAMVLAALLGSLENLSVPNPLLQIPSTPRTAWTAWLQHQPADTVIAQIPFPAGLHVADYAIEGWRLFHQIDHHQLMVNGYSGYFPPAYGPFQLAMALEFPKQDLLCTLGVGLRVNTLVVDQSWLRGHQAWMAAQSPVLRRVYHDAQVTIYRLRLPTNACTPQPLP